MATTMSVETPQWARDAVFYQIFPDRFARSDRVTRPANLEPWNSPPTVHGYKGGDLYGVAEQLDYLQDLGVTALLLNPIFSSTANHRYHTHDYYTVDPLLGGNEAFRQLLEQAHSWGMRVVLDGVFNHTGRGFYHFSHIAENGAASPYTDWFTIHNYPLRPYHAPQGQHGYAAWWNMPALPKLNVATPAVREFLWEVASYWIEFGADGWRLDVPADIDDDPFWREFRLRVKAISPEAYIVGEIWHDAQRWLRGDQFDAVMNYPLTRACLGFFAGDNLQQAEAARCGYHWIERIGARQFSVEAQRLHGLYPQEISEVQLNLLGSHDTPRFKTLASGDSSAYRLAFLFLATYPGAPCIYYGDEVGMTGRHDPGCRAAFDWDEHTWDRELREYVKRCIALRNAHAALRRGAIVWLQSEQSTLAYCRQLGSETFLVVLNSGQQPATINLAVGDVMPDGVVLQSVWAPDAVSVNLGRAEGIHVAARAGVVFRAVRRSD